MSRTEKIAEKLHRQLPKGFTCADGVVFRSEYEFVTNGIMAERTAYKDTYYARRINNVFFADHSSMVLNYSTRFENTHPTEGILSFCGGIDEVVKQIFVSAKELGLIDQIGSPYTLRDFLEEHCPWPLENLDKQRGIFDFACAAVLTGNIQGARPVFHRIAAQWDAFLAAGNTPSLRGKIRLREISDIIALLDGPEDELRQHIIAQAEKNAWRLGFELVSPPPSTAPVCPEGLDARLKALATTARASMPRPRRGRAGAQREEETAAHLVQAGLAWARAERMGEVEFARHFFDSAPDAPGVQPIRDMISIVAHAETKQEMQQAADALAAAIQEVGPGRWAAFLQNAASRAETEPPDANSDPLPGDEVTRVFRIGSALKSGCSEYLVAPKMK